MLESGFYALVPVNLCSRAAWEMRAVKGGVNSLMLRGLQLPEKVSRQRDEMMAVKSQPGTLLRTDLVESEHSTNNIINTNQTDTY